MDAMVSGQRPVKTPTPTSRNGPGQYAAADLVVPDVGKRVAFNSSDAGKHDVGLFEGRLFESRRDSATCKDRSLGGRAPYVIPSASALEPPAALGPTKVVGLEDP